MYTCGFGFGVMLQEMHSVSPTQQNAMIQSPASTLSIVRKLVTIVSHLPLPSIANHVMICCTQLNIFSALVSTCQVFSHISNCHTCQTLAIVNTCQFQTNATQLFNFTLVSTCHFRQMPDM